MKNTQLLNEDFMTIGVTSDGRKVSVEEVKTGKECNCFCPYCKQPLIAKNRGKIRQHHFVHFPGVECRQTHSAIKKDCQGKTNFAAFAIKRVRSAFYKSKHFQIELRYYSYCPEEKKCKIKMFSECYTSTTKTFDLKSYYDCCEEETKYKDYNLPILKLSCSKNPERRPIYIVFNGSQENNNGKWQSSERYIECKIESESDIEMIENNGLSASKNQNIAFYNFKDRDYENKEISQDSYFYQFVLYGSGEFYLTYMEGKCKEKAFIEKNSICEITFYTQEPKGIYDYGKYLCYGEYKIPNCKLCQNYTDAEDLRSKICKLKPNSQAYNTSYARKCPSFSLNLEEYNHVMRNGIDVRYNILREIKKGE